MRKFLTILTLLLPLLGWAQSVPDTNTFSLDDVRVVLGLPPGISLIQCFANADDAGFDPAYEGSKNSLLNFRNYAKQATNTLSVDPTSGSTDQTSGSTQLFVYSNTDWTATSTQAWLTITPDPTTGNGNANFTVSWTANTGSSPRSGSISLQTTSGTPTRFAGFSLLQLGDLDPIEVGRSFVDGPIACASPTQTYWINGNETFSTATALYSDNTSTLAPSGYYSYLGVWRQWDGAAFTTSGVCP